MSIQGLTNNPVQGGSFREARRSPAAELSFQELLSQTEAVLESDTAERPAKGEPVTLYDAQVAMLERMKLGKEKDEEEEAWDKLMEYVDAWIETLRDEGDLEKTARAYSALEALKSERSAKRIEPEDVILKALTERIYGTGDSPES